MARPATAAVRLLTGEREPVRLATTANIALYGLQTVDGVVTDVGDRVLVKNQADARENGIYTASEGQWFRAADARTARTMQKGTTVHVQQGMASADFVYAFETLNPVIGTDAITLTFFLSEDTLGDATAAATAAANSAAAALTSKNAAATSATNAGTSATAASGSAMAAATSATNAGNSATVASGSATTASTQATNAVNSATAAAGSATAASGSATAASGSASTASTQATNASNSATAASTSATAVANSVAAIPYAFSTTTTDADPGNGIFRLNNATIASATAAYVDNQDSDAVSQTGLLDTFDDSTNTIRGTLTIRSKTTAATKHVFNVSGSVVDGTGYRKLTLAYVAGSGSIANAEACWLFFSRTGDKGADGTGTGDVSGPASAIADHIARFNGTTGKLIKDGGTIVTTDIADAGVTLAKMADMATASLLGRSTAGTGAPEVLSAAGARTVLNVANGATANSTDATLLARANHTGTQSADTVVDGTTNKAYTATEKTKLAAVGTMANRAVTISTASPSGGTDGDVWFQI